jgi:hypothetical protein
MLPRADDRTKKPRNDYREAFLKGTGPRQSSDEVLVRTGELEAGLEVLKVTYEQFFLGLTRHPPRRDHDVLRSAIVQMRGSTVRNGTVRFRVGSLYNRLLAYERLWERTIREIEDGTYRRDLFKAKLRRKGEAAEVKEAADRLEKITARVGAAAASAAEEARESPEKLPAREAAPPGEVPSAGPSSREASAPRLPRPAPPRNAAPAHPLSDDRVRAIYDAYVSARRRCKESTQGITYENVAATLRKQMPALMLKHNASAIDFKVVIKGGKAVLKAVPR